MRVLFGWVVLFGFVFVEWIWFGAVVCAMLGARLALCCSLILVEKKTISACIYVHTAGDSAWSHAGGVQKNALPTRVQALKNVVDAKQKLILKQSCGTL